MTPTVDPDDRLATLLSDAVCDVEPADRLAEIRDRTKVVGITSRRPWLFGVGGAVVATAAVLTAIALASGPPPDSTDGGPATSTSPTPSGSPSPTTLSTPLPSGPASGPTSGPGGPASGTTAYADYYVGDGPKGPVLFREFHAGDAATPLPQLSLEGLSSLPTDRDYRTPWRAGDLLGSSLTNGVIRVTLGSASLHDRPAGMSSAYAGAAVQQVVYTLQAAYGTRAAVQFVLGQNPIDQVLGVATSEPLANDFSALSQMNITSPADGAVVSRGKLVVSGVNNGFEGTAVVWLERDGTKYLMKATIGGWGSEKLYPWSVQLDLSTLAPGEYTLVASDDDPSGQGRADTDNRVLEVR